MIKKLYCLYYCGIQQQMGSVRGFETHYKFIGQANPISLILPTFIFNEIICPFFWMRAQPFVALRVMMPPVFPPLRTVDGSTLLSRCSHRLVIVCCFNSECMFIQLCRTACVATHQSSHTASKQIRGRVGLQWSWQQLFNYSAAAVSWETFALTYFTVWWPAWPAVVLISIEKS